MATQRKTNSKLSSQAVMEEVKNLAMLGSGVVLGSVGGRLIDKVLKGDGTETVLYKTLKLPKNIDC